MKKLSFLFLFLLVFMYSGCSKKESENRVLRKNIIAIVATDTIFVNDFIRRCEFTVRPVYCQKDGYHDKNICLNSLIAEKLFALEAGTDNPLMRNPNFRARLQGIKEQLMREEMIRDEVVAKIKILEKELQQAYKNSKKTIHTEAVLLREDADVPAIIQDARNGTPFGELAKKHAGVSGKIEKDVQWGHTDRDAQAAIFSDKVTAGTVLAPQKVKDGYRLIKVTGWSENIELSRANQQLQVENVKAKLMDYHIREKYREYAQNIMKGKRIDFNRKGWQFLVKALEPFYLRDDTTAKVNNDPFMQQETFYNRLLQTEDQVLMTVNDDVWRIKDLRLAIRKHPLEIGTKALTKENFPHRLRAAIAGLITDTFLTDLAREKGYDQSYKINRTVDEWKRYYLFLYQRDRFLQNKDYKGRISTDYFEAFDRFLTPYFDSLKVKYDSSIRFNPQALQNFRLTRLPMIAHKTKGPYTQVVPPFPLVTNSIKTNYKRFE